MLLDRGAELAGSLSEDGRHYRNPLEEASRQGHQDVVDLLLSRGATWAELCETSLPMDADETLLYDWPDWVSCVKQWREPWMEWNHW